MADSLTGADNRSMATETLTLDSAGEVYRRARLAGMAPDAAMSHVAATFRVSIEVARHAVACTVRMSG